MEVIRLYYYQGYFSFSVLFLFFLSTVERLLDGIFFCFSGLIFVFRGSDKIKLLMDKIRTKNESVFVHDFPKP